MQEMLKITGIRKSFSTLDVLKGVDLTVHKGEVVSLIGPSGSGKTTLINLIPRFWTMSSGDILFDGISQKDLTLKSLRAQISLVSQDVVLFDDTIAANIAYGVRDKVTDEDIRKAAEAAYLLPFIESLPDGFNTRVGEGGAKLSGGQRQRISIARALASNPEFLICDEPTSALDVSVQAQILNLMLSVQKKAGLTYLFISHNLSVVHHISDRVGVMYLGRLVELAPKKKLFASPKHPYTKMLLDAIPDINMTGKPRVRIEGEVPNPLNPPSGCAFHPRCPYATERCRKDIPQLMEYEEEGQKASVACHLFKKDESQQNSTDHEQ